MQRPIKNFDFLFLSKWDYFLKYNWSFLATGFICSVMLGLGIDEAYALQPYYQNMNTYLVEHNGVTGRMAVICFIVLVINALLLSVLRKISAANQEKKTRYFHTAFLECMGELALMKRKQQAYDVIIADEFMTYQAAEKARTLIALSGDRWHAPE